MKELILITSSFPIENSEPFLKNEYPYLKEKFDKIDFVVVLKTIPNDLQVSTFGEHDVVEMRINTTPKVKLVVSGIFNKLFWRESIYILSNIKLRYFFSSMKVAIVSLDNAKLIRGVLQNKVESSESNSIVIYSYWGDSGAIAASQLADHPKVHNVVTRVHGWDVYFGIHSPPYLPFRTLLQKKCHGIYPISEKGKFTIQNVWKVPSTNIVTSRLGVDAQAVQVKDRDGVFTLVSCSNIIPLKRVQLIAEAVLSLNRKIKWVHFGAGSEFERISAYVEQSKKELHEIVFFGNVENAAVLDFYRNNRVDVFINASTTEGIPFSIMEAISFGIPVFATNVGGNSEIVDESNGVLLPENPTAQEIATQLERFMDLDAECYQQFATGSYKKWEKDFNAEKNFTRFVDRISE
jgi:glycosyltransferase involved in cell wall biosynthesis